MRPAISILAQVAHWAQLGLGSVSHSGVLSFMEASPPPKRHRCRSRSVDKYAKRKFDGSNNWLAGAERIRQRKEKEKTVRPANPTRPTASENLLIGNIIELSARIARLEALIIPPEPYTPSYGPADACVVDYDSLVIQLKDKDVLVRSIPPSPSCASEPCVPLRGDQTAGEVMLDVKGSLASDAGDDSGMEFVATPPCAPMPCVSAPENQTSEDRSFYEESGAASPAGEEVEREYQFEVKSSPSSGDIRNLFEIFRGRCTEPARLLVEVVWEPLQELVQSRGLDAEPDELHAVFRDLMDLTQVQDFYDALCEEHGCPDAVEAALYTEFQVCLNGFLLELATVCKRCGLSTAANDQGTCTCPTT